MKAAIPVLICFAIALTGCTATANGGGQTFDITKSADRNPVPEDDIRKLQ